MRLGEGAVGRHLGPQIDIGTAAVLDIVQQFAAIKRPEP
jgi:hypothetical protein